MTAIADWDVIDRQSRSQAIKDGEFIDITAIAQTVGFRCPTTMTRGLFETLRKTSIPSILIRLYVECVAGRPTQDSVVSVPTESGDEVLVHVGKDESQRPYLTLMRPCDW